MLLDHQLQPVLRLRHFVEQRQRGYTKGGSFDAGVMRALLDRAHTRVFDVPFVVFVANVRQCVAYLVPFCSGKSGVKDVVTHGQALQ